MNQANQTPTTIIGFGCRELADVIMKLDLSYTKIAINQGAVDHKQAELWERFVTQTAVN